MTKIRTYTELILLPTLDERFEYLKLSGTIGVETFGFDRYLNQKFYNSREWKDVRDYVIARDLGCDLGVEGHDIHGKIYVHHMNPIIVKDIVEVSQMILDPEYLITTSLTTHNAIHYGDESQILSAPLERRKNDTCPWKL